MDVENVFRLLTSNKYIIHFNYATSFSFQTVFYFSRYSYCSCECAFEHEYLDYILDSGGINKEMYNRVLENILNGKCPHVDKVDEDYTRETSITAIHIAAALGAEKAIKRYWGDSYAVRSGVFSLSLFQIALLKQRTLSVNMLGKERITANGMNILCYYRSEESRDKITIESVSPAVFCVRKRNRALLKAALSACYTCTDFDKALELTFKYNLTDMVEELIGFIKGASSNLKRDCIAVAIVNNRPDVLTSLLQVFKSEHIPHHYLYELCTVMKRNECADVLHFYHSIHATELLFDKLSGLDLNPENIVDFPRNIISKLKTRTYIQNLVNQSNTTGLTRLHYCVNYRHEEVKILLELGADVNRVDDNGHTPLISLLSRRDLVKTHTLLDVREIVGMLLQGNPSIDLNEKAVELAIVHDELDTKTTSFDRIHCGEFETNVRLHSVVQNSKAVDKSLLFLGSLLIECGFPVTRDVLYKSLLKPLHEVEKEYIRRYLKMPRSLELLCRDTLRKRFPGRDLNHFIDSRVIPNVIKDFILLRYLF